MSKKFDVDFYFGNQLVSNEKIKKLDYTKLNGFQGEFEVKMCSKIIIWKNLLNLLLKKYDIYILTGRTKVLNQWLFLLLARLMNRRTYNWWHGFAPGHQLTGLRYYKEKVFFSLFTGHLIYGDKARTNMINMGFPAKKMVTIYNSLDYETSLNLRNGNLEDNIYKMHFKNNFPVLLFIGRLTKIKKLDLFLQANERLKSLGYRFNVVLIGDGPEKEKLEQRSKKNSNVWFYGALYDELMIAKLLYNADLCISPGNVGLTAIHAIYYGLPVVTNDNFSKQMPEHEAIIPLKTGDFFINDSIDSLVQTIIKWFELSKNRDDVRKNCYKIADNIFNPFHQVTILENLFSGIEKNSRKSWNKCLDN